MWFKTAIPVLSSLAALAAVMSGPAYSQERVCRQECAGAVCEERCTPLRDGTVGSGRRDERRDPVLVPEEKRGPPIELRVPLPAPPLVPQVDVEINR